MRGLPFLFRIVYIEKVRDWTVGHSLFLPNEIMLRSHPPPPWDIKQPIVSMIDKKHGWYSALQISSIL